MIGTLFTGAGSTRVLEDTRKGVGLGESEDYNRARDEERREKKKI